MLTKLGTGKPYSELNADVGMSSLWGPLKGNALDKLRCRAENKYMLLARRSRAAVEGWNKIWKIINV